MRRTTLSVAALFAATSLAQANDLQPALETYMQAVISAWANDPMLIAAVAAQNETTGAYTQGDIDALDQAWRSEVGAADQPTITPVVTNEVAEFLRQQVAASGGSITEIFVMDARGLNVAASAATSDFWQGDEAKHAETFGAGADAVHFSEIEFDESSQSYQAQISFTLADPATGAPIGAVTVGVDATSLN
ncbi:MAG: hypothetical protein AAGM21_03960 [Pseudomonadota bacterium]